MATLNAAVQQMIDRLNAALAAGTASAEDQLLIGKALQALQSSTTWERALIAVAEEHLNTSTTALAAAKALLDAAKVTLDSSSAALNTQAANLARIPTMDENIANARSNFLFSSSASDAILTMDIAESSGSMPRAVWSVSLDDYQTGQFTSLTASHNTSGNPSNCYANISADGTITSAATGLSITAGTAGLLPSTESSVRLFNIPTAMTSCIVYNPTGNASLYTFAMSIARLYLDPVSRIVYSVNNGRLIQATATASVEVTPTVNIASLAALEAYAAAQGWVRVDQHFAAVANEGLNWLPTVGSSEVSTGGAEITAQFGSYGGPVRTSYLLFNPAAQPANRIERVTAPATVVAHLTTTTGLQTGVYCIRSALVRARFRIGNRKFREVDIEVRQRHNAQHEGRGNTFFTPTVFAISLIHNAVILRGGFTESAHGSSRLFTGLSFGR